MRTWFDTKKLGNADTWDDNSHHPQSLGMTTVTILRHSGRMTTTTVLRPSGRQPTPYSDTWNDNRHHGPPVSDTRDESRPHPQTLGKTTATSLRHSKWQPSPSSDTRDDNRHHPHSEWQPSPFSDTRYDNHHHPQTLEMTTTILLRRSEWQPSPYSQTLGMTIVTTQTLGVWVFPHGFEIQKYFLQLPCC